MSRGAEGIFAGSGLCQGMARRGGAGLRGRKPARSPGAQLVAVAVLAGWKAELGERRGEAEVASPSWARPFVVAGGSTCALKRALVQAGIEAKSARQSPPFW